VPDDSKTRHVLADAYQARAFALGAHNSADSQRSVSLSVAVTYPVSRNISVLLNSVSVHISLPPCLDPDVACGVGVKSVESFRRYRQCDRSALIESLAF
jgi:hypothetical protein